MDITRKYSFELLTPSREDILVHPALSISHCSRSVVPNKGVRIDMVEASHNRIGNPLSELGKTVRNAIAAEEVALVQIFRTCVSKADTSIKFDRVPAVRTLPQRSIKTKERMYLIVDPFN
jgi:hypothetical protein